MEGWMMGCFTWDHFWPEGRLCPCVSTSPNELSPCSKHTSGWGPISLESRSVAITASGWWHWAQGSTSSHAGSPKHWRIISLCCWQGSPSTWHASDFIIWISLILASILPAFQAEEVTGLYPTAQHRIIHQSWQQLCAPGRDETRLAFLILLFLHSSCFWNKVTFNNLPSKLPFRACSKSQPWNKVVQHWVKSLKIQGKICRKMNLRFPQQQKSCLSVNAG